ncbi:MAG TPA: MBL fold metallo-hydrolase [Tissierellaceae bacterium]|nr:MBL fold metallo-hydrolase [Tissierellaceae bacterium]
MHIKFCSLSSGSSGNCHYIETKNSRIIIDAGLSGKAIERLMSSIGADPSSIDGIFVTHEHIDHSKGVGILSRRFDIPIYANSDTWLAMKKIIGKIKEDNIRIFTTDKHFEFKDLTIHPIAIFHDAAEPVGYVIYYKNKKISVVTDTGWVNNTIIENIKNSNLYLIESNHDVRMLKEGTYPWPLKQRILSTRGHLSNDDCGRVMGDVLSGSGEIVLLGHLSEDNNHPDLALKTVRESLENYGLDIDNDISLGVTHRDHATKIFDIG